MAKKLTVKEAKLVKAKAEGKTNAEAYKEAGYSVPATKEAAVVNASKVLSKPHVKEALHAALEKHGLTPDAVVGVVADGMKAEKVVIVGKDEDAFADVQPDHNVRLKAAGMAANFMGINKESPTVNINFNQVAKDDAEQFGI